jgi:gliding motility-associated-like protein
MLHKVNSIFVFLKEHLLLLFCVLSSSFIINAQQISVSGEKKIYTDFENRIDYLILMYDININSEISIIKSDPSLTVKWTRYPDMTMVSNQSSFVPDDHTGYIAELSGTISGQPYHKELTIWVIDYKLYQPTLNSLSVPDPNSTSCNQLTLTLNANIPDMYYKTVDGTTYNITRKFNLTYNSLEWDDEWKNTSISKEILINSVDIQIDDAPLQDTYFTLSGDEFSVDFNKEVSVTSSLYQAIRVAAKIKTEAFVRVEKNEGDRPEDITTLTGSAPLEINFTAQPNGSVPNYFRWEISKGSESPFIVRTGENYRYSFTEAGTFNVKLIAENSYCSHVDSVTIKVSESAIYAPNVFTPNGDGFNDEFRVAYKSIIEFDCWIFNRWGNMVYHWTDPQKGWDGKFKGKPVNEGAYFYVIKAKGSDGIIYNLKGDINLLRGKKQ